MTKNKRKHIRIKLPAKVKLMHPDFGEVTLQMRDMSDSGVYVYCDDPELIAVGTVVRMQAINEDVEMPVVEVKVVRKDNSGMGMEILL